MDAHTAPSRPLITRLRCKGKDDLVALAKATLPDLVRLDVKGPADEANFKADAVHIESGRLLRFSQSGYHTTCRQADCMRALIPRRGQTMLKVRNSDHYAKGGRSAVVHWGTEREVICDTGVDGYFLEYPLKSLERFTESLTGQPLKTSSVAETVDLETGPGVTLISGLAQRFSEWDALDRWHGPRPASGWYLESLVALLLVASVGDVRSDLERVKPAASGYIDRARELIEASATQRVSLTEIAESVGVSVRSLQLGFMRHFGCTPMQHLISCRLDVARRQLLAPTDATTVTGVAIACGFLNVGAFAGRYRTIFGELPSDTLRRSKGALKL